MELAASLLWRNLMETLWFALVALMVAGYVVLDGFDLGAGIIHFWVAKTQEERSLVLKAIGPVWDGNEVWLLAGGGTLFFAFPMLYASGFSGFYLPLMMVLWLMMLRGLGIEFRSHVGGAVWKGFFDGIFSFSSILLSIFFGATLGNVIRGVPLQANGYFFEPLWTNFQVGPHPGILDWYTVLVGVFAFVALTSHGALYVATKTEGDLHGRARKTAAVCWWVIAGLTLVGLAATLKVRPGMLDNYKAHPLGWLIPLVVIASLIGMLFYRSKGSDKSAFVSSSVYIAFMLVGAVYGLYPCVLPASTDPRYSLTIYNSGSPQYGMSIGIIWWMAGMFLAIGYFVYVYRMFRGKVSAKSDVY
jgi:cytochrome d ubiquinol oxidase subunit II